MSSFLAVMPKIRIVASSMYPVSVSSLTQILRNYCSSKKILSAENNTREVTSGQNQSSNKFVGDCRIAVFGSKDNKGRGEAVRPVFNPQMLEPEDINSLEPPSTCCMSGCANCVWIEYAEALTEAYSKSNAGKERLLQELNQIQDQNIKAFILLELRTRGIL